MRIRALFPALLLLAPTAQLATSAAARAQATVPYPPPGYARSFQGAAPQDLPLEPTGDEDASADRLHDRGPYLRLAIGPSHSRFGRKSGSAVHRMSGTGASISAAAGTAMFSSRLTLFGELTVGSAFGPLVSPSITPHPEGPSPLAANQGDRALTSIAAGAGMGLWLDTWDLQVLASFSLSQARLVDRRSGLLLARTRFGPTLQLGVLRNWAVAEHLAVGLLLRAQGARLGNTDAGGVWWGMGLTAGLNLQVN